MAYSNFTFDKIRKELSLITEDKTDLFSYITEVKADEYFSKNTLCCSQSDRSY